MDAQISSLPERFRPGIGLRPGGGRPEIEAVVPALYAALYGSIAEHSRSGLNIVTDVGHHDSYSKPLHLLAACAKRLSGLPVLFVGVRCPINVIMARRAECGEGRYLTGTVEDPVPAPVHLWQSEAHIPGIYDLEVETSILGPQACAAEILALLRRGGAHPSAFARLTAKKKGRKRQD